MIACAAWRVRVRAQPEPATRSLYELQRQFAAALFEVQAQGPQSDLAAELGVDPLLLAIHRNTASATLTAALALNFPAVRAIVGADFFEAAAGEFLRTRAPASACLNDYGDEFPRFLAQFAPAASLSYLADVARLEWAVSRALHAADAPALELGSLAALAPERMPFVSFAVHPAMSVLHLESPADAIWRAVLSAGRCGHGRARDYGRGVAAGRSRCRRACRCSGWMPPWVHSRSACAPAIACRQRSMARSHPGSCRRRWPSIWPRAA